MKQLIGLVAGLGLVTVLVGEGAAMVCAPTEVAVKTKAEIVDVNGNIVVAGSLGCAQSVTPDGRIRVIVNRLDVSENGAPRAQVTEIAVLPSEVVGR